VGFEFDVKVNNKTSTRKNMRKVIQVNALDTIRVMHEVMLDETGLYRVSVKLWDPQFKSLFTQTPIGEERQFLIASRTEIEEAQLQMTGGGDKGARRPISLQFDPPDLRWESAQVIPKHALRGERLRIRLNLMNVGGDIVQGTRARIEYFNTRQPRRKTIIGTPTAYVMAPGEVVTFDLEYVLPEDQLLGEYQVVAMVDPDDEVEENKEDNNEIKSNIIQLSDIKLLLPTDGFVFEENGLFLFQWDSLVFSEFKIQIGVDDQFEDGGAFFDLPQGDRWIADKEIVPLSGELPGMAMGLMKSLEKNKLYWRVIGRKASGQQTISEIRTFSINPVTGGKQS
ncbi:MAG: CARDB domain-containing protein, partial [SAR324 cluster bacterium]|nr:CARDB domain-containing protein [SAR324 cluster bacterium]